MSRWLRSFNPSFKFISLMVVTLTLAFFHDPALNVIVFVVSFGLVLLSGTSPKKLALLYAPILLAALGAFVTGYRYSTNGDLPSDLTAVLVSDTRIGNGLIFATRVLVYASVGFLFALTTDRVSLVRSLEKQLKLPPLFAYGLLAAVGIFPQMAEEYRRTRAAFRARGIRALPISPAVLKPLLVKSVRWSEALAVSMESKGFDGGSPRTSYEAPVVRKRDWALLLLLCIAFPVGVLLWYN